MIINFWKKITGIKALENECEDLRNRNYLLNNDKQNLKSRIRYIQSVVLSLEAKIREYDTVDDPRTTPYGSRTKEQKKIYALEEEIKQLKKGLGATGGEINGDPLELGKMNEVKFRQFKAHFVAHKKLCIIIADKLYKIGPEGLDEERCDDIARMLDPDCFMTSKRELEKHGKDILKLISK